MSKFRFKLQPLQRYREHQRDLCRQILARFLARDAEVRAEQVQLEQTRHDVLAEMTSLQQQPRWNIDQAAARRYHAAQLLAQIRQLDVEREQLARQLELCRQALAKADQGVKVLERLGERQLEAFTRAEDAKLSRELEELWQAGALTRQAQADHEPLL